MAHCVSGYDSDASTQPYDASDVVPPDKRLRLSHSFYFPDKVFEFLSTKELFSAREVSCMWHYQATTSLLKTFSHKKFKEFTSHCHPRLNHAELRQKAIDQISKKRTGILRYPVFTEIRRGEFPKVEWRDDLKDCVPVGGFVYTIEAANQEPTPWEPQNEEDLNLLIKELKAAGIPWDDREGGCYARANFGLECLRLRGISPKNLSIRCVKVRAESRKYPWGFHQAIEYETDKLKADLDPTLFDRWSTLEDWFGAQILAPEKFVNLDITKQPYFKVPELSVMFTMDARQTLIYNKIKNTFRIIEKDDPMCAKYLIRLAKCRTNIERSWLTNFFAKE